MSIDTLEQSNVIEPKLGENVFNFQLQDGLPEEFSGGIESVIESKMPLNLRAYVYPDGQIYWSDTKGINHGGLMAVIDNDLKENHKALLLLVTNSNMAGVMDEEPSLMLLYDPMLGNPTDPIEIDKLNLQMNEFITLLQKTLPKQDFQSYLAYYEGEGDYREIEEKKFSDVQVQQIQRLER